MNGANPDVRELYARLNGICNDMGGPDNMSEIAKSLAERFIHSELLARRIEAKIREGAPVEPADHAATVSSMARVAKLLGVKRQSKPVKSLEQYIAERDATTPDEDGEPE